MSQTFFLQCNENNVTLKLCNQMDDTRVVFRVRKPMTSTASSIFRPRTDYAMSSKILNPSRETVPLKTSGGGGRGRGRGAVGAADRDPRPARPEGGGGRLRHPRVCRHGARPAARLLHMVNTRAVYRQNKFINSCYQVVFCTKLLIHRGNPCFPVRHISTTALQIIQVV